MHNKEYSVNILHRQQDGQTALIGACKKENVRNVELLLKASADPDHMTMVGVTGDTYTNFDDLYENCTVGFHLLVWMQHPIL